MSDPMPQPTPKSEEIQPQDGVEAIVTAMPYVLPLAGGVLIFLLALIAISVA